MAQTMLEAEKANSRHEYLKVYRLAHLDEAKNYRLSHKSEKKVQAQAHRLAHPEENKQRCRAYYKVHRLEELEKQKQYRLANPGKIKQQKKAFYDKWKFIGLEKLRQQRKNNPENSRKAALKWAKVHPKKANELTLRYKARKKAAFIEKVNPEDIFLRDKGICQLCHKRVSFKGFSLDHIIPLSKEGAHASWNLQITHLSCNISKGVGRHPSQIRFEI